MFIVIGLLAVAALAWIVFRAVYKPPAPLPGPLPEPPQPSPVPPPVVVIPPPVLPPPPAPVPVKPAPPPPPPKMEMPTVTASYWSPNINHGRDHVIDTIVLHNTEGAVSSAVARFMDAGEQVSAHYITGKNGTLTQCVVEGNIAWHAGNRDINHRSIGIENEAGGNVGKGMTGIQEDLLIQLVKFLMQKYDIHIDRILPHRDCVATDCPGSIWPTDEDFNKWKRDKLV